MKNRRHRFHRVLVAGRTVSFPKVCPHCLRPATDTVTLESSRSFAGYYIFATKWKYFSIEVPVCADAAQRVRRSWKIFGVGAFSEIAIAFILGVLRAFFPTVCGACTKLAKLDTIQFLMFWLIYILPFCLPQWFSRPEKYIRISSADESHVEFGVRDAEYARVLAANNGPTVAA